MADVETAWVMYTADYDTGRQYSRIIPDSVRILRASTNEFNAEELRAERERTGLHDRLQAIQIEVPPEVANENLAAYAERYISLEPGFDFWDDVIGEDIVVEGIAYNGDRYAPDGEGGVRPLTDTEQAAREATIGQREADWEAEQTAREAQRRQQAIDYASTSVVHQPTGQNTSEATDARPADAQAAELRERAAALRADLDNHPSQTAANHHDPTVLQDSDRDTGFDADVTDTGPPPDTDVGIGL